jgi:hypothetical protein
MDSRTDRPGTLLDSSNLKNYFFADEDEAILFANRLLIRQIEIDSRPPFKSSVCRYIRNVLLINPCEILMEIKADQKKKTGLITYRRCACLSETRCARNGNQKGFLEKMAPGIYYLCRSSHDFDHETVWLFYEFVLETSGIKK